MRSLRRACMALCLAMPCAGQSANWLMADATEPVDAGPLTAYASISVEYQASQDTPLLAGAWRGQADLFNRFAPRYADGKVLQVSAAVAGLRGRLLQGQLNYRLGFIAGENAIVRGLDGVYGTYLRPLDASLSLNYVPHARLRVGLVRQALGDEAAALDQRHIYLSHVTQQIVQERYFASDGSVDGGANLDLGPVSAFRDYGLQLFDALRVGAWEHAYALMLGMGTGVDPSLNHAGVEKYAFWSSERIFDGSGVQRDGLKLYAWIEAGRRDLKVGPTQQQQTFDRRRAGVGATLRSGPWRLSGEWIEGTGMIYNGSDGGAIPGSISNVGARVSGYNQLPTSKANGWYVDAGYRLDESLEARLRFDVLNRGTDSPTTDIRFQGLTVGGAYAWTPRTQLLVEYQFRRYNAPQLPGDGVTNVLLGGVDNRVGARLVHRFSF